MTAGISTGIITYPDRAPAASARLEAISQLPGAIDTDPFERLVAAFLVGYPQSTARAYLTDLKAWATTCANLGTHPFDARRHHVDVWVRQLESVPLARTGQPMAPASIARRLSAISAFYDYGIGAEVLDHSPTANVRRPKVPNESTTVGLSADEAVKLLDAAEGHSPRAAALVSLLVYNGVRIDEALSATVTNYTYQQGHRVLRITRKGGRLATIPLNPMTVRAIDAYLAASPTPRHGWLWRNRTNDAKLAYSTAFEMIKRLARKADIPAADQITPHSFRHMFVTEALAAGVPLQDVQDAAGHADPRTTRRYDRGRHDLDQHPTYVLASHLRRADV